MSQRHSNFSEGQNTITGAEIFASGVHRGEAYTDDDLDQMVSNFNQFSTGPRPLLRVPAVLGHEETQEFLDRSDLPAAAWTTRLYREGHILKADFADVPNQVANLIKGKRYRTVSAEVYASPPEGIAGEGHMLRRVAFLGGDVPQIKAIGEIPLPESHAERFAPHNKILLRFRDARPHSRLAGVFTCFAEVQPMDPLSQLQQMGWDTTGLEQLSPEEMAAVLRNAQSMSQQGAANPDDAGGNGAAGGGYDDMGMFGEGDLPDPGDDPEKMTQYADFTRKMADRVRKMMEKYCGMKPSGMDDDPAAMPPAPGMADDPANPFQAADPSMPGALPTPPPVPPGLPGAGRHPSQVTMKYSEIQPLIQPLIDAAVAEVRKEFAVTKQQSQELADNTRRANIEKFVETQWLAGRVLPPQKEAMINRLMRADPHTKTVHKFSENGKVVSLTLSELEVQQREIERGPLLIKYGEKVVTSKAGAAAGATGSDDPEVARVEMAFEKFSEGLIKRNPKLTKEIFVDGFKKHRALIQKDATARDYLPASMCEGI